MQHTQTRASAHTDNKRTQTVVHFWCSKAPNNFGLKRRRSIYEEKKRTGTESTHTHTTQAPKIYTFERLRRCMNFEETKRYTLCANVPVCVCVCVCCVWKMRKRKEIEAKRNEQKRKKKKGRPPRASERERKSNKTVNKFQPKIKAKEVARAIERSSIT